MVLSEFLNPRRHFAAIFPNLILTVLLWGVAAPARVSAQGAGDSAPRLSRIDSLFAGFQGDDRPGCALGVIRDGELVVDRGYGMGNLDLGTPITGESVFYLASVSKQFTAAAVALASLEGHLSLDDDIRLHFPELPDYGQTIRIRHLLHHTSGLRDYLTLMSLAGMPLENVYSDAEILGLIFRQQELNFPPGEEHLYSNTNYVLLAELISRTTGMTLAAYAQDRIFEPLGMTRTHFHDDASVIVPGRVFSYAGNPRTGYRTNYLMNFDKVGDGGLYSSIHDLYRWDQNFYHKQVGGEDLHKLLHTQGVLNNGDTITYAMGLGIREYRGLPIVQHGGSLMGFRTGILRFPQESLSVIALCNTGQANPSRLSLDVAELFLEDRMTPEKETPSSSPSETETEEPESPELREEELALFTGTFYSQELDATYRFLVEDGILTVGIREPNRLPLEPVDEATFQAAGLTFRFWKEASGEVSRFSLDAGRVRNLVFRRVE